MSLANAGHTRQNDYGRVGQNLSNALSSPLGYPIQGNNKTKKSRPSSAEGTMMGRRLTVVKLEATRSTAVTKV
jgi:hypothetical protein